MADRYGSRHWCLAAIKRPNAKKQMPNEGVRLIFFKIDGIPFLSAISYQLSAMGYGLWAMGYGL
jgi:hypothetical protein